MPDLQINVRWKPYPWQKKVLRMWHEVEYLVVLCGRQMGKTTLLLAILLETSAKKAQSLVWYVSPTLLLAGEQYYKFKLMLDPAAFQFNDTKRIITCPNGSRIMFVSYQQGAALRGPSVDLLVVDEVGSMDGSFVRDVLEPTTTHTGGHIIYCGTPPDPLEAPDPQFFEGLCKYAKTGQDNEWAFCVFDHRHVSRIEPTYRKKVERYKRIHGEDSLSYKREYLCEFVRAEELSLPFDNIRWFDNMEKLPRPMETVITVDPSFSDNEAADPRAIVTTGLSPNGDLYVMRAEQGRWGYNEFIARVRRAYDEAKANGWNPQYIGIEKAGVGQPFVKALQREGEMTGDALPLTEIPNFGSTLSRIMSLEPWMQDSRVVLFEKSEGCQELADQAELFPRGLLVDKGRVRGKSGMMHHYDVLNALSFRTMNFYPPPRPTVSKVKRLEPGEYDFGTELAELKREATEPAKMYVG